MLQIVCPVRVMRLIKCLARDRVTVRSETEGRSSLQWAIPPTAGLVTNDTVVSDPLFTVPITATGTSLCFEVHGSANRIFNLVSDVCTTVNAHYTPMDIPENGNIISRIGVRAVPNSGLCKNVRVELDGCRAFIDPVVQQGTAEVASWNKKRVNKHSWRRKKCLRWMGQGLHHSKTSDMWPSKIGT